MYPSNNHVRYEMSAKEPEFAYELRRAQHTEIRHFYRLSHLIERLSKRIRYRFLMEKTEDKYPMEASWSF